MRGWLAMWFKEHESTDVYFSTRNFPNLSMAYLSGLVTRDLAAGVRRERLLFAIIMLLEWWNAFQIKRQRLILR